MSLRLRVALAATAAVLVMVVVSSVALYVGVRRYLYHRADASLTRSATLRWGRNFSSSNA